MKKTLIASLAALMIAAPFSQALAAGDHGQPLTAEQLLLQQQKGGKHAPAKQTKQKHSEMKKVSSKKHWQKGQRMSDWKSHSEVRDYKSHGLHKPGNGQRWVKVDNEYVLVSIASGVIAGIIAAH